MNSHLNQADVAARTSDSQDNEVSVDMQVDDTSQRKSNKRTRMDREIDNDNDNDSEVNANLATVDKKKSRPPKYNEMEMARTVFSNVYFYHNQQFADLAQKQRESELQEMTVGEIYIKFIHNTERGLASFADKISALGTSILRFFAQATLSVEDALVKEKFVILTGVKEVDVFKQRVDREAKLPTVEGIWKSSINRVNSQKVMTRTLPVCLVLGPSGSGKTCFSLNYLTRGFLNSTETREVVVYLHPGNIGVTFQDYKRGEAAKEMMECIRKKCESTTEKQIPRDTVINMHMCIILDEAGSTHTKKWFENKAMLEALCTEGRKLARSVTFVVVGTGLTGSSLSSVDDVYFFRMKEWEADDLSMIFKQEKEDKLLMPEETILAISNAVFANPKLSALATNARSAFFLVKAIVRMSHGYSRMSWDIQLEEWTPALVTEVVDAFINSNRIRNLDPIKRRRVAASVFHAVHKLQKGDPSLPGFPVLGQSEIPVAESLLQFNLEQGDQGEHLVKKPEILPGEKYAFTLTPALVIVMYTMAGIPTTLLPGWRGEEELAALYAVRQLILQSMERFASKESTTQLDESLEKIRLLRLQKQLQSKNLDVYVPIIDDHTVIVHGTMASSFADVVAPRTFFQAKRTSSSSLLVEMYDELQKCGLLKDDGDTRLLRGLLVMWGGEINMTTITSFASRPKDSQRKNNQSPQDSKAFPENLLSLVPPKDPIRFGVIKGESTVMITDHGKEIALPKLDGTPITFVLSTNADTLNLRLLPSITRAGTTVTIKKHHVNHNLEIIMEELRKADKQKWTEFCNRLLDGVVIKILFTK